MKEEYKFGHCYFIKDKFYEKFRHEEHLMRQDGHLGSRPTYFCSRFPHSPIMWMVPMSTKVNKYREWRERCIAKYGRCDTIIIGQCENGERAFLLQNMFPVTPEYISHEFRGANNDSINIPIDVKQKIGACAQHIFREIDNGNHDLVFADVKGMERELLNDLVYHQDQRIKQLEHSVGLQSNAIVADLKYGQMKHQQIMQLAMQRAGVKGPALAAWLADVEDELGVPPAYRLSLQCFTQSPALQRTADRKRVIDGLELE